MTSRTVAPIEPHDRAKTFIRNAMRLIAGETSARLVCRCGAQYLIIVDAEVIREGVDADLDLSARRLTQAAVGRLQIKDRERLMRRMDSVKAKVSRRSFASA